MVPSFGWAGSKRSRGPGVAPGDHAMTSSTMTGLIGPATISLALCLATAWPASALTMKECGEKYQAAKAGGKLKGMTWNGYRKAECGDDDVSLAEATASETAASDAAADASTKPAKVGRVVYPREVAPKYANESPGRARMHTCVDQYNANKASGANGRLKWVSKGGGYFSQCNKRLKS
jgi:hypothetical protein